MYVASYVCGLLWHDSTDLLWTYYGFPMDLLSLTDSTDLLWTYCGPIITYSLEWASAYCGLWILLWIDLELTCGLVIALIVDSLYSTRLYYNNDNIKWIISS